MDPAAVGLKPFALYRSVDGAARLTVVALALPEIGGPMISVADAASELESPTNLVMGSLPSFRDVWLCQADHAEVAMLVEHWRVVDVHIHMTDPAQVPTLEPLMHHAQRVRRDLHIYYGERCQARVPMFVGCTLWLHGLDPAQLPGEVANSVVAVPCRAKIGVCVALDEATLTICPPERAGEQGTVTYGAPEGHPDDRRRQLDDYWRHFNIRVRHVTRYSPHDDTDSDAELVALAAERPLTPDSPLASDDDGDGGDRLSLERA